jgi:16S rRNA G966 N2-methylase RsmD
MENGAFMAKPITKNTLFYGDNLPILREYIPDESVDLIYLDPPFKQAEKVRKKEGKQGELGI